MAGKCNYNLGLLLPLRRGVNANVGHTNIRTRLRFTLLRSVVTALLRGVRLRGRKIIRCGSGMKDLSNVNVDFVPVQI